MNSKQMQLSKIVNKVMGIMEDKNLPHTYFEVAELVQHFDGDMKAIKKFIHDYELKEVI